MQQFRSAWFEKAATDFCCVSFSQNPLKEKKPSKKNHDQFNFLPNHQVFFEKKNFWVFFFGGGGWVNPFQPKQIPGCDVGSKENELQMEASACLAHEEVDDEILGGFFEGVRCAWMSQEVIYIYMQ